MPNPTILLLDDQLATASQREVLQRYLDILSPQAITLIKCWDIDDMYKILKQHKNDGAEIDGFLIDLMLPQCKPNMTFASWGVPTLELKHHIGGAQVIKLMRHSHYANKRSDPNHPLHVMKHFANSKIGLFTTYEDGVDVMHSEGITSYCDFIWKDKGDIEQQLTNWILSCAQGH